MDGQTITEIVVVQMAADTTQPIEQTEPTGTTTRSKTARVTRSKVAAQSKTKDDKPYNVHKKTKPVAAAPIQPRRTSNRERPPSLKLLENIQYGMTERLPPPQLLKSKDEQTVKPKEEEVDRPVIRTLYHYQPTMIPDKPVALPYQYTQVIETPLPLPPISPHPEKSHVAQRPRRPPKKRTTVKTTSQKDDSDSSPYCDTPSPDRDAWFAQRAGQEKKEIEDKEKEKEKEKNGQKQKRMPSYQDIFVNILDDDDDGPLSSEGPSPMINGVGHIPAGVSTYESTGPSGPWLSYLNNY